MKRQSKTASIATPTDGLTNNVLMRPFDKAYSGQVEPLPGHDGLLLARFVVLVEETKRETLGQPFRLSVRLVQNCFQLEQMSDAEGLLRQLERRGFLKCVAGQCYGALSVSMNACDPSALQ